MAAIALILTACNPGGSQHLVPSTTLERTPRHAPATLPPVGSPHEPIAPRADRAVAPFEGLGTWIDVYDHSSWKDPSATVTSMKADGVQTLYLQTSNYSRPYDVYRPDAVAEFITAAHESDMQVVSWYLPGLANQEKDLRRTMAAIEFQTPDGDTFDGFGLDIEAQILDPPGVRSEALVSLSQKIRSAAPPGYPLAAVTPSPVALADPPNGWPDFPFFELNALYDAFVPMDYFTSRAHGRKEVYDFIVRSVELLRAETGDPLVAVAPIGGIAVGVSAAEARGFVDAVLDEGLLGGSLYDYRTTTPEVSDEMRGLETQN